ncbi:MAG: M20/M25/M40 family metallo-hydrolase [Hyphomicrobiales bacterium]|nr:M20/M25/M40 family metallo-hydrolase [Hyphomicrobiales bacterium]
MSDQSDLTIRDFLAARRDAQTDFLGELVRMPSDNPPGDCAAHAAKAAELLEALGFTVECHDVPTELAAKNGMISATNLIVRERFGEGPTIALNAHGDVVPPGLGWTVDPYSAEIRDGFMYGRGVAVSKSDFATYAFALLALKKAAAEGAKLAGGVELHLTYDEEAGGAIGPGYILDQGLSRPDYAISAGFAYDVVTAHNGCLHLEVEVIGKSAHAAMPESGVDALEATTDILGALYGLRRTLRERVSPLPGIGAPGLTVGLISGGINTNVVPDKVTFRIDRRITPDEDAGAVDAELRRLIEEVAQRHEGISLAIRCILLATPFVPIAGQDMLAEVIQKRATSVIGAPVGAKGVPIYTDARLYSSAGIPTVLYGAGPRTLLEANGHRADEKLKLDDLYKATEIVALTLMDLLAEKSQAAS